MPPTSPQNGRGESIEYYQLKAAALAGECQEIFMAAVQIPVDDLLDIGMEKSILPFKSFLITLEKGFKMILRTPIIIERLRVPWTVNGGGSGHDIR